MGSTATTRCAAALLPSLALLLPACQRPELPPPPEAASAVTIEALAGEGGAAVFFEPIPVSAADLTVRDPDGVTRELGWANGPIVVDPHGCEGSVYELPYEGGCFDLVVSFSVFEHLHDYPQALSEIYRVLSPGGLFLLGMPSVNRLMEAGFHAIGFGDINDHHVTTPAQVERAWPRAGFHMLKASFLDVPARSPLHLRLYHTWLLEKPLGRFAPAP